MTRWKCLAAACAAVLGAGPVLAQYDLPLPKSAPARGQDDPRPVYKYELKPEHGDFFVCVKTYSGQYVGDRQVKEQAEGLAEYIRTECRQYAFVYERNWLKRQERKKELAAVEAAKQKYYTDQGLPVPEEMRKVKMTRLPDEYSVLVAPGKGTLKTLDEAVEFAKYVRELKAPPDDFCDHLMVAGSTKEFQQKGGERVNPFKSAMPGPNPAAVHAATGPKAPKADEFLMRLNSSEDYSLVHKTKKAWTLVVKTYGGEPQVLRPGQVATAGATSVGERLERAAMQAHQLAELLRKMNSKFEAFVLHTPYNSIVCVGDFDKPDEAGIIALSEALASLPLTDKKKGEVLDTLNARPLPTMIPKP